MYSEFLEFCKSNYSWSREAFSTETPSPNLFSFLDIKISQPHFEKIQKFISNIFELRENPDYQNKILGHAPTHKNYGVLMSYDFHISGDQLKLIEINTNASHFLTSYLMAEYLKQKNGHKPIISNSLEKLKESFLVDFKLSGVARELQKFCIVDEDPNTQRGHFEFLMYQKIFEEMGYACTIEDYRNLKLEGIDFVYNRHTDFYFEESPALKQAYDENLCCISPHPEEYQLLAEKDRMMQFSDRSFLAEYLPEDKAQSILDIVPEIFDINLKTKDEMHAIRKKYFFKPKNAFGGKGVFNGASISRKVFEQVYTANNYLAQEFAEPGKIMIRDQVSHETEAKWDLRVYVYKNEIQHVAARAYVGQTTNFRTLGGGFAAVSLL